MNALSTFSFSSMATGIGNNGNLQVIAIGASDGLPYLVYQVKSSGSWYWFGKLPNPNNVRFNSVTTGIGNNGNLQVIGIGASDGFPYLIYQVKSSGSWYWFGRLPDPSNVRFSLATTGKGNVGNLQVIGIGASDGRPYLIYQVNSSGSWYWYGQLPDPNGVQFGALATVRGYGDTTLHVIGRSVSDGLLYLIRQSGGNGGWFWYGQLPNPNSVPMSAVTTICGGGCGTPWVISISASGGLPYSTFQSTNSSWVWWGGLPDPNGIGFSKVTTGIGVDQYQGLQLEVIGIGTGDGRLYLISKGTSWFWNGQLPNPTGVPFKAVATGIGNGDNLQVIGLGANDQRLYLTYQVHSSGNWYFYGQLPIP